MVVAFVRDFANKPPVFLPDSTPIVSYAAFQLLAFAMERQDRHRGRKNSWDSVLDDALLHSLNMKSSALLCPDDTDVFAIDGLNLSQIGEPG